MTPGRSENEPGRSSVEQASSSPVPRPRIGRNDPVRGDLVARVRAEIRAGTYDSDDKIDACLAALLDELRVA